MTRVPLLLLVTLLLGSCHPSGSPVAPTPGESQDVNARPPVALEHERLWASDPRLAVMGRVLVAGERLEFGFPGVTVRVCFRGTRLWVTGSSNQGRSHLATVHQGTQVRELVLPKNETEVLAWQAPEGAPLADRCVDLVHLTETWIGVVSLRSFRVEGEVTSATPFPGRKLLFIGDSVTCGEAVRRKPECSKDESWWDAYDSFGAQAARLLEAQSQLVCFGGRGVLRDWQGHRDVLNAPEFFPLVIPDERRIPYPLSDYVPDAVLLSLGTNDFNPALGPFPERAAFVAKYVNLVRDVKAAYPAARLWLTEGAIVSDTPERTRDGITAGKQKTTLRAYIEAVVERVGRSDVRYLPARHYPADACDAHPTGAEHERMADDVAKAMRVELGW